jgi:hypothetical protein
LSGHRLYGVMNNLGISIFKRNQPVSPIIPITPFLLRQCPGSRYQKEKKDQGLFHHRAKICKFDQLKKCTDALNSYFSQVVIILSNLLPSNKRGSPSAASSKIL